MIAVIPSARSIRLDYLAPLIDAGVRFIVVDDSPGSIHVDHPQFEAYSWVDQERMLGPLARAIPRHTGACRDFGFFLAWTRSDPGEVIIALDDDCAVEDQWFAVAAEQSLQPRSRPRAHGRGKHWNVLDLLTGPARSLFPRGFPYSARVDYEPWSFEGSVTTAPSFHLGLWRGVFDINAIDKVTGPPFVHDEIDLIHECVVVPKGVLVSVCSMNMVFRREVIPAVYQLPMHVELMSGHVADRFGDIWGGFILKTLMDRRGDVMTVGSPTIRHLKEGDYLRNIWQEHLCHLMNDEFVDVVQGVDVVGSYLEMVEGLVAHLEDSAPSCSPPLRSYLSHLVPAMEAWTRVLRAGS